MKGFNWSNFYYHVLYKTAPSFIFTVVFTFEWKRYNTTKGRLSGLSSTKLKVKLKS